MNKIHLYVLAKTDIFLEGLLRILMDDEHITVSNGGDNVETCIEQLSVQGPTLEQDGKTTIDVLLIQAQLLIAPFDVFFSQFSKKQSGNSKIKILVFGQSMDNDFLLNILRSGANGYINSNMSAKHLLQAVDDIYKGKIWAERTILEQLAQDTLQMENLLQRITMDKTRMISDSLTTREAQVLQWLLKGLSTKEIAQQTFLSEQSIKLHLGKLFKKFAVSNRFQLILSFFEKVVPINNLVPLMHMTLEKKAHSHKEKK